MATNLDYKQLIKQLLLEYAKLKPAVGDIESKVIFDDLHGSYALMQVGWNGKKHVHGSVIHIDLIDSKIWIQYDGTESGIASELADAGIPKEHIVLGFRPEHIRHYTEYAVN